MKKTVMSLVLAGLLITNAAAENPKQEADHIYPRTAIVTETDQRNDIVKVTDGEGFTWEFYGVEDWEIGDGCSLIMNDNGTADIKDDQIIQTRYFRWNVKVYETAELTAEKLENRTQEKALIIEHACGKVLDKEGNGKIINAIEPFNYISYRSLHLPVNTIVNTYFIYNPTNDYIDDIMIRIDFVNGDCVSVIGG